MCLLPQRIPDWHTGLPSWASLYPLSLAEAKNVQATQKMPDGTAVVLPEAYRHGDALIVDTCARLL